MSSVLSDADKASMVTDFQSVIDTFLRPLIVYQEAIPISIITDPNYNPLTSYNQNSTGVPVQPSFTTISGRILYDKNQEWSFVRPYVGRGPNEGQLKIKDQITRSLRLKVDASGYALLNTAKKVQIDGNYFDLESVARPHGLFSTETYTFYFVRAS